MICKCGLVCEPNKNFCCFMCSINKNHGPLCKRIKPKNSNKNAINLKYNLYIVYFINCLINPNYYDWLLNQLKIITNQINKKKINLSKLQKCKIYIIASINNNKKQEFINYLNKYFFYSMKSLIEVEFFPNNNFEYQGIKKVWDLGQFHSEKNDIILYFHSKGISRNKSYSSNRNDKYNIILKDLNKIFKIFDSYSFIDKIGYSCGGNGWIWYNFWFARGSYLNLVEKPIITNRRHYYEDWLGRIVKNKNELICSNERPRSFYQNTLKNCYCFHSYENIPNIGYYYNEKNNKYFKI